MRMTRQGLGMILGPCLFILLLALPLPTGMPDVALRVAAVTLLMATWWISEAAPLPATALLPIVLFPILGVMPANEVTTSYAHHIIYLFLGGFLLAAAIERWQLHKRIALRVLSLVGMRPARVVLGFMLVTAFLSAWISNTAATLMMVTIGIAVLGRLAENNQLADTDAKQHLGTALMLGIAYAASIGGIATLIGSPPNAILAGIMEANYGTRIGFLDWLLFGLPLSVLMLTLAWFYLTRLAFPLGGTKALAGHEPIMAELRALGPMSRQERRVLVIFSLVVLGWILRGLVEHPQLHDIADSTIAISGALLLFVTPTGRERGEFLLDWQHAARIPWDILILFGGGLALAKGVADSGLSTWLGTQLSGLEGTPLWLVVGVVVLLVIFLTEVSSNTATASLLLPVLGGFAVAAEIPALSLMAAAAVAASFAFMLPVATPPNAIVFSSRQVTIPQMARAGIWLNLVATVVITLFALWLLPLVWPGSS